MGGDYLTLKWEPFVKYDLSLGMSTAAFPKVFAKKHRL